MKFLVAMSVWTATALADTAQLTILGAGPFVIGQEIFLTWSEGNGLPISLSIVNATWTSIIFNGQPASSQPIGLSSVSNYSWIVSDYPGFIPGDYRLALAQFEAGISYSDVFQVLASDNNNATATLISAPVAVPTITYTYWDEECGCSKTGTAVNPMNTGLIHSTSTWWDDHCGCRKTAVVPMTTFPTTNNYTVPASPPPMATTIPSTNSAPTVAHSAGPVTHTGQATKLQGSVIGMIAMTAALAMIWMG